MSEENTNVDEEKKPKSIWGIIRIILIVICLLVVVYESVQIYRDQKEYEVASSEYEFIAEELAGIDEDEGDKSIEWVDGEEDGYPKFDIDYGALKVINEDYIGWIYFPSLEISYPVVQEQEINEYLTRTFRGNTNKAGSIFMDVLSNSEFTGYSDFVFGHNMRDLSMFGSLKKLLQSDEDLLEDSPYIYIYTKDYVYRYRIFAYYRTSYDSNTYDEITSDESYDNYIKYIKSHTVYDIPSDVSFESRPSLLTLSTCSGPAGGTTRFVVHSFKDKAWEITED